MVECAPATTAPEESITVPEMVPRPGPCALVIFPVNHNNDKSVIMKVVRNPKQLLFILTVCITAPIVIAPHLATLHIALLFKAAFTIP